MKHTDLAQDYFERHSQSDECFITSDGRVFHTYGHATSFAQEHQLQDQTIESYKRNQISDAVENSFRIELQGKLTKKYEELFGQLPSEEFDNETLESLISQEESRLIQEKDDAEILEEFKSADIETADYNDLKAFAKHFKIVTADQKKETLIAALTDYKNSLNS